MGRNPLILYASGIIVDQLWGMLNMYDLVTPELAWLGLVMVVGTIAIVGFIGWALNKGKIYLRI